MITYASYIAANPLPRFPAPLRIEYGVDPPVIEQRTHRIARPADSAPKLVRTAEYVAALSRTEWRTTATISVALDVAPHVVKQRLMGVNMRPLVEVRTAGRGGRYEWRLK